MRSLFLGLHYSLARLPAKPMSNDEFNKRMQEMIQIPEPPDLEEQNKK